MSQTTNSLSFEHSNKPITAMHTFARHIRKLSARLSPRSITELMVQIEEATTSRQLNRAVNRLQDLLWKLPQKEQALLRQVVVDALTVHVHSGSSEQLRLEAAGWLRLFVQAGLVIKPEDIFVTLVTAAIRCSNDTPSGEQKAYLRLIFDCFWPFRPPSPAYTWEALPKLEVFYPLASLLEHADDETRDILLGIFAELPTLDDRAILKYLLPVALGWAKHPDAEHRRRVTHVLARISCPAAQEALHHLRLDTDPLVRESAKTAIKFGKTA